MFTKLLFSFENVFQNCLESLQGHLAGLYRFDFCFIFAFIQLFSWPFVLIV